MRPLILEDGQQDRFAEHVKRVMSALWVDTTDYEIDAHLRQMCEPWLDGTTCDIVIAREHLDNGDVRLDVDFRWRVGTPLSGASLTGEGPIAAVSFAFDREGPVIKFRFLRKGWESRSFAPSTSSLPLDHTKLSNRDFAKLMRERRSGGR